MQPSTFFRLLSFAVVLTYTGPCWGQQPTATIERCADPAPPLPGGADQALAATVLLSTKKGQGSGVIISPDGYVLTAAHVVTENDVEVKLYSNEIARARVMRLDEKADVALLRIVDGKKKYNCLPVAIEPPKVGDDIYVLGSPGGDQLAFSVSRGIVSAFRTVRGTQYIQTDAAVNVGNSGGPLVSKEGQVVAIASFKIAGKSIEGLGFGVPTEDALAALGLRLGMRSDAMIPTVKRRAADPTATVPHRPQTIHYPKYSKAKPRAPWVIPVRLGGYSLFAVALTGLATSVSFYAVDYGRETAGPMIAISGAGTALGIGMVVSSHVWGQPEPPQLLPEEDKTSAATRTRVLVGPGQIAVGGSF